MHDIYKELLVIAGTALITVCAAALIITPAHPQTHEGHAEFHDVYKEWLTPYTRVPCCNAKYDDQGKQLEGGDCYPTTATYDPKSGVWTALTDDGRPIQVTPDKIVREKNPDPTGTRAHLCESGGYVFCFVPPFGGM